MEINFASRINKPCVVRELSSSLSALIMISKSPSRIASLKSSFVANCKALAVAKTSTSTAVWAWGSNCERDARKSP